MEIAELRAAELKFLSARLVRDLCRCLECRHPVNGQRLRSILDLPLNLAIEDVFESQTESLFSLSDGHQVLLSRDEVEALKVGASFEDPRSEMVKFTWEGARLDLTPVPWNDYLASPRVRLRSLREVAHLGFMLLTGVPRDSGSVLEVIDTFGFVRETNYGKIFDVQVEERPNNLAFTNMRIAPHTDNPYRNPVPSIQLLHCLATDVEGGNSGLVDGFKAAQRLREISPKAFGILSQENFHFTYSNANTYLEYVGPVIRLNTNDEIVEVRWNDRSMQSPSSSEYVDQVFDALSAFATILNGKSMVKEFRLNPGDCVVFDNTRMLHSRTSFESSGTRHLQGAYADLDSLLSSIAVLERGELE